MSLDPDCDVDINELAGKLHRKLPSYAQPMFIRRLKQLDLTGTFKLQKGRLKKEGFDIRVIEDPVYFKGPKDVSYVELNSQMHADLLNTEFTRSKL